MTVDSILSELITYQVPFLREALRRQDFFFEHDVEQAYLELQVDRDSGESIGFRILFPGSEYPKIILFNTCTKQVWCNVIRGKDDIEPYTLSTQFIYDARHMINHVIDELGRKE
jgi:hypothetical protein